MQDQFKRSIEYLRISITDRCNLRCTYCMPDQGVNWLPQRDILTYEEILRVVRIGVELGFKKFRVTGGEPLVRKGVISFLQSLASTPGVKDVSLTTNGILLGPVAAELKQAGVRRVNISLDTLDSDKFSSITRGGKLSSVLQGIEKSLEAGLNPVKVNMVVMRGFNDYELEDFANLAREYPLHVRFIELMPIGASSEKTHELMTVSQMKESLGNLNLIPAPGVEGAGPARHYSAEGFKGTIGFISALSQHFCASCNRVRLTADGKIKPCLHSFEEFDLRTLLRTVQSDEELQQEISKVIWQKPSQHHMSVEGWEGRKRVMSQIGG